MNDTLTRFGRDITEGRLRSEFLWVVGPAGAVHTHLTDLRPINSRADHVGRSRSAWVHSSGSPWAREDDAKAFLGGLEGVRVVVTHARQRADDTESGTFGTPDCQFLDGEPCWATIQPMLMGLRRDPVLAAWLSGDTESVYGYLEALYREDLA